MEGTSAAVKQDPSQSAEQFMRQVRRQNRKKFTAEEKIRIVLEGMKRVVNVAFKTTSGKLLPGGAFRLNLNTDSSYDVPHADLAKFMGLTTAPVAAAAPSSKPASSAGPATAKP